MLTIVSSVVVPFVLLLVGHRLSASRDKSAPMPAQAKTFVGYLADAASIAAPAKQRAQRPPWLAAVAAAALIAVGALTAIGVSSFLGRGDIVSSASTVAGFPVFVD